MNPEQEKRGGWTSASNAGADELCEGRHLAQKGLPEEKRDDSEFGRKIHAALAADDPSGLKDDESALSIYEQCVEIRERVIAKFFGDDAPNIRRTKHRRLWCQVLAKPGDRDPKAARYQHSGETDFLGRHGKRALIVEYKALPGDVPESPSNKQTRDQAVLAAGELLLSEVGVVIVQPLVTHDPVICLYTGEALKKAEAEMFNRVRRSNNPEARRTANPTSCKFCLARHTCTEYQKWVTAMAPKSDVVAATPVEQWTPEMRAHFLTMRPAVQQWLDDCYARLKQMLKDNPETSFIPGYKLKEGNTVTTVTDPQELFKRFVQVGSEWAKKENGEMHVDYVLMPIFMSAVTIGNEKFTAAVRKVTGLKGQALDKMVKQLRDGLCSTKQNDHSLAKDT